MKGKQAFDSLDVIYIELTNSCNFDCIHCGNDAGKRTSLDIGLVKSVLADFNECGGKKIMLTGGEPLMYPDIEEILRECARHEFVTHFSTNAFLLNSDRFDFVFDYDLIFRVSLDGTRDKHNEIRRNPFAYDGLISAMKKISANEQQVILRTTVMKQNKDCIADMLFEIDRLTKDEGIKIHGSKIWPMRNIGRANPEHMLTPAEYRDFLLNLNEKTRTFNPSFKIVVGPTFGIESEFKNGPIQSNDIYTCNILSKALEISFTGDVYPCSFVHYSLGNIATTRINDIFRSEKAIDFREKFLDKKSKTCDSCSAYESCKGGCIAENYQKLFNADNCKVKDVYCFRECGVA